MTGLAVITNDDGVQGWTSSEGDSGMCLAVEYDDPEYHEAGVSDIIAADGPGWYHRLTKPGYLDCTDWSGPFLTAFHAIRDGMRTWNVDLDGNCTDA